MDKTVLALFAMVGVVAATGIFLFVISAADMPSTGVTGYAVSESGSGGGSNGNLVTGDVVGASSDDLTLPTRHEPSAFTRTLTILFTTFLLAIAAYVYFHPNYS